MARSILDIAKEAAERDSTAAPPATLFGSNAKIAKLLRVAAKDTLREYLRLSGHSGLSEFHSTWVFSLQPGRFAYPLPPDFLRMIPNTEHRGGWPLGLIGPVSPQAWSQWLFGGGTTSVEMGWRIRNGAIFFDPIPSVAELVTIEYVSNYPVVSGLLPGDYDFTGDMPVAVAPFVPRDGHIDLTGLDLSPPQDGDAMYNLPPGWDVATWGEEVHELLRVINPMSSRAPLPQVRRPEFVADTDKPPFEDDYALSLGMTFRLRRALGLDYAEAAGEYESEMDQRLAHDAGGARTIRLGGDNRSQIDCYPVGDGRWMVT